MGWEAVLFWGLRWMMGILILGTLPCRGSSHALWGRIPLTFLLTSSLLGWKIALLAVGCLLLRHGWGFRRVVGVPVALLALYALVCSGYLWRSALILPLVALLCRKTFVHTYHDDVRLLFCLVGYLTTDALAFFFNVFQIHTPWFLLFGSLGGYIGLMIGFYLRGGTPPNPSYFMARGEGIPHAQSLLPDGVVGPRGHTYAFTIAPRPDRPAITLRGYAYIVCARITIVLYQQLSGRRAPNASATVGRLLTDGTVRCSYLCQEPGHYALHVTMDGRPIAGSPYAITLLAENLPPAGDFAIVPADPSTSSTLEALVGRTHRFLVARTWQEARWEERPMSPDDVHVQIRQMNESNRSGSTSDDISVRDELLVALVKGTGDPGSIFEVEFIRHKAGHYQVSVQVNGGHVHGSPFVFEVSSGEPDYSRSQLRIADTMSPDVYRVGDEVPVCLDLWDEFGNPTKDSHNRIWLLLMPPDGAERRIPFHRTHDVHRALVSCGPNGRYTAQAMLGEEGLQGCCVSFLVLSEDDHKALERFAVSGRFRLRVSYATSRMPQWKALEMCVTQMRIIFRESILFGTWKTVVDELIVAPGVIETQLEDTANGVVRLVPRFRDFILVKASESSFWLVYCVLVRVTSRHAEVATTFAKKVAWFNERIREHHKKRTFSSLLVHVSRHQVVSESMAALPNVASWCRPLAIQFEGERGIDAGGPRREWFTVLGRALFGASSSLFEPLSEGSDRMHPVPNVRSNMYTFCGRFLGKKLLDDAFGLQTPLDIMLSRSCFKYLLAQENDLGLRDMEVDDPVLFRYKVQFLLENDVSSLGVEDLTFSEEVLGTGNKSGGVVDLKSGGRTIKVTNENKEEYVRLLVEHRLHRRVSKELNALRDGLQDIIPLEYLAVFDCQELELLLCGIPEIDVDNLKRHVRLVRFTRESPQVIWFFRAVEAMQPDERARLLQFVTGGARPPAGGFARLDPPFQISRETVRNKLPKAMTCSNLLLLPPYESYEELSDRLTMAVTEFEGFEFS